MSSSVNSGTDLLDPREMEIGSNVFFRANMTFPCFERSSWGEADQRTGHFLISN